MECTSERLHCKSWSDALGAGSDALGGELPAGKDAQNASFIGRSGLCMNIRAPWEV